MRGHLLCCPGIAGYVVSQVAILGLPAVLRAADGQELAAWQQGVGVSAVLRAEKLHSIHSYFNTSPESPDGRHVLLFRSPRRDAHHGDVCAVERRSGQVRVLASGVTVEDAHRVACQQWVSGGRRVVYHDLRDDEWVIVCVELQTGKQRILAKGRQLAWGQAHGDIVPLYGPHWDPGKHRDLELLDVGDFRTGQHTVIHRFDNSRGAASWRRSHPHPVFSPDGKRLYFNVSSDSWTRLYVAERAVGR